MHPTQLFGTVVRTYKLWELKTWVTSENSMSRCRHVRASEKRSRSKCGRRIHVVCQFCQEVKEILCICSPAAILTKYPEIQRDSSESHTEWQVTFQMHPQANILSKNDESDWCSLYFILSFPMHIYIDMPYLICFPERMRRCVCWSTDPWDIQGSATDHALTLSYHASLQLSEALFYLLPSFQLERFWNIKVLIGGSPSMFFLPEATYP